MTRHFPGIGVSRGLVAGRAVILMQKAQVLRYQVSEARVEAELARLEASRTRSRDQLSDIRTRLLDRRGPELAGLFDAQLLMLDDPMLVPQAAALIRQDRINAEWAVQRVLDDVGQVFDEVADPYLRERKGDVADVLGRLRMNLQSAAVTARDVFDALGDASILIADELTPSLAAQVDWTRVRGFATDAGSHTYHTAILARSLGVPAVVGLRDASRQVRPGDLVVVDAVAGELVVDPDSALLAQALVESPAVRTPAGDLGWTSARTTADGVGFRLEANLEFPDDIAAARAAGAEGVGLFRSEFLLAGRAGIELGEEEQYGIYRQLVEGMAPSPVTVRTFDLDEGYLGARPQRDGQAVWGGDARGSRHGLRGLRLSLSLPEFFGAQLRALLRAARHGDLRILLPFVSSVEQVRAVRAHLAAAHDALVSRGETPGRVRLGVMIEVPAAAYTADILAREVDFLTIGTNDLIQYTLAVDRSDERVSDLYAPLHPAMLRMLVLVRRAAARARVPLALCGEMAADPGLLALLVGMGLREFSMAAGAIPMARHVLSELRVQDLQRVARRVLRLSTAGEIEEELLGALSRLALIKGVTS